MHTSFLYWNRNVGHSDKHRSRLLIWLEPSISSSQNSHLNTSALRSNASVSLPLPSLSLKMNVCVWIPEFIPQAFGMPLSQVIANDRAYKLKQDLQRDEQKDASDFVASLLPFGSKKQNKELSSSNSSLSSTSETPNESTSPNTPEPAPRARRRVSCSVFSPEPMVGQPKACKVIFRAFAHVKTGHVICVQGMSTTPFRENLHWLYGTWHPLKTFPSSLLFTHMYPSLFTHMSCDIPNILHHHGSWSSAIFCCVRRLSHETMGLEGGARCFCSSLHLQLRPGPGPVTCRWSS